MAYNKVEKHIILKSVKHILNQGQASTNEFGVACNYRDPSGKLSCAAAPFIKRYDPTMEGYDWVDVVELYPENVYKYSIKYETLVMQLQLCHDNCILSEDFIKDYVRTVKETITMFPELKEVFATYGY